MFNPPEFKVFPIDQQCNFKMFLVLLTAGLTIYDIYDFSFGGVVLSGQRPRVALGSGVGAIYVHFATQFLDDVTVVLF